MKREIKFRCWSKKDKVMVSVTKLDFIKQLAYTANPEDDIDKFRFWDFRDEYDAILMQYTGLKDKAGEEIYEGDIVKTYGYTHNQVFEVKYQNGGFYPMVDFEYYIPSKALIIIGNIYENPELLKSRTLTD